MSSPSATQSTYPCQNELTWSKSEKAIARTAFDAALKRELQDVMRKNKAAGEPYQGTRGRLGVGTLPDRTP